MAYSLFAVHIFGYGFENLGSVGLWVACTRVCEREMGIGVCEGDQDGFSWCEQIKDEQLRH